MRKLIALFVAIPLLLATAVPAMAATSQDVTVTATPSFISIANSPGSFDFGIISTSTTPNTGTGYFSVTNDSTVAIDINIGCNGWSGTTSWTYGAAGADTAQLNASAGTGAYDTTVPSGSTAQLINALAATTDFTWELELEAPNSFTHGAQQTTTVTITAVAD